MGRRGRTHCIAQVGALVSSTSPWWVGWARHIAFVDVKGLGAEGGPWAQDIGAHPGALDSGGEARMFNVGTARCDSETHSRPGPGH